MALMTTPVAVAAMLACLEAPAESSGGRTVVLVELFTSEGCSSCPPAEQLLPELVTAASGIDVIPLAFHVDYWNYLGWRDRFSSPSYSARQQRYAETGRSRVFTPQLIIDGTESLVGSDRRGALRAITDAAAKRKSTLTISVREGDHDNGRNKLSLKITGEAPGPSSRGGRSELFLAVAEDGLFSEVTRGENSGQRLQQEAVVRRLVPLGGLSPGRPVETSFTLRLDPEWNPNRLRCVAWIEAADSRRVLAAAQVAPSGHQ